MTKLPAMKFVGPTIYTCGLGWRREAQSYYWYAPGAKFAQRSWAIVWERMTNQPQQQTPKGN